MRAHNPFAPPSADLTPPPESFAAARKPYSVWVVQILGGILAAWCAFGLIIISRMLASGQTHSYLGIRLTVQLLLQACFVALLLLMLWNLPRRSKLGRNLGLGLIALLATVMVIFTFNSPSGGAEGPAAAWGATAFFVAPLAYWAYAFAFSAKARRYFVARPTNE